jgi:hypothetical protein
MQSDHLVSVVHFSKFPPRPLPSEPTSQELKARAEAKLKFRAEQAIDKPLATAEYRAAEQNRRDVTATLRSERLARDQRAKRSLIPPFE